jgi:hypothetical protein
MRKLELVGVELKGDLKIQAGVSTNYYYNCHKWVSRNYGSANKCENPNCEGWCKKYHYALKKGCNYEKNRDVFMMLCQSCHTKYDWKPEYSERISKMERSPEMREKISKGNLGKKVSDEVKQKMSIRMSGKNNPMYGISVKGENHHFYGKSHTDDTKKKLAILRAKLTENQVIDIKNRFKNGQKQIDISAETGFSRPLICKILKGQRYKQWQ